MAAAREKVTRPARRPCWTRWKPSTPASTRCSPRSTPPSLSRPPGLADNAAALAQTLADHMKHEENQALPLVEAHLGPAGWAAFRKATGKIQGLRGGAEFFPWMLDGASADTSKRVLSTLPPPARLLYRAAWRPRYGRTPRWDTPATRTTTERPGP